MTTKFTTTESRDTLIQMFLDATPNEVYSNGQLATREVEGGVELIAYGNEVLAFANEKKIDFFIGHHGSVSPTVTSYIKRVGSLLNENENREVNVWRDAAPTLGEGQRASDSAQYIKNYVTYGRTLSSVERDAVEEVRQALTRRMEAIFG